MKNTKIQKYLAKLIKNLLLWKFSHIHKSSIMNHQVICSQGLKLSLFYYVFFPPKIQNFFLKYFKEHF